MPITLADLQEFNAAYPNHHFQIQMVPPGQAGAVPMLGFIVDGEFITTEADFLANGVSPSDARRLHALNYGE